MRRPRTRRSAAGPITGVLAALALSGCADAASEPPAPPSAHLVVEQRMMPGGPRPIEGSFGFFELRGPGDQSVESGSVPTTRRTTLLDRALDAGEYTLISYQRLCEANCGNLAPPTSGCEEDIRLEPEERLTAVVRVRHTEACTISTR